MKVQLSNPNFSAEIDDEDYHLISHINWHLHKSKKTNYARGGKKGHYVYMHRLIYGPTKFTIDHKDRNGLNNKRNNLREATSSQQNSNILRNNQLGYRGVTKINNCLDRFRSKIMFQGKEINLGNFSSALSAAKAYNMKARELFGEFAILNEFNEN